MPSLASSSKVASGLVISQAPVAGDVVKKGARVSIVVSGGPASESLTNVAGLTAAQAAATLRKAGFKTTTKTEASKTVEAGHVIGTEPPAETEVQEGHVVTLLVSSGPAPVRVPDVTGQSLEAAEATLTNAELRRRHGHQEGLQHPGAGHGARAVARHRQLRARRHKVNLTVAKAPKEVEVPNVVGGAEVGGATAALEARRLQGQGRSRARRPNRPRSGSCSNRAPRAAHARARARP